MGTRGWDTPYLKRVTTDHTYATDSQPLTFDGRNYYVSRTYDPGNRRLTHTFADRQPTDEEGRQLPGTWAYDFRNLVTDTDYEGNPIVIQAHDDAGPLTNQTFGNGLTRTIAFGRLDNLRTSDKVFDGGIKALREESGRRIRLKGRVT